MLPLAAVKLVPLNWAIPFWVVLATLMVITAPAAVELAILRAPLRPSTLLTTLLLKAKPQLALVCKQTVPDSFGKLMARLAVGAVKLTVVVKLPLVAAILVLASPAMTVGRKLVPTLKVPPLALTLSAPLPWKMGLVTLVVKLGLLIMVASPRALKLKLPLALTATVPEALGIEMVRLAVSVVWLKVLLKPSAVPSLKTTWPTLLLLPNVRPVVPCKLKLAKAGLAVLFISWMVLTTPLATLKLVLLN